MAKDTELTHQPHPIQQKPLVLVAIALFIAFIAGTGGYWLGRRNHQTTLPHPQEIKETNTCARAEVQSIKVSPELEIGVLHDPTPAKIEIASPQTSETTSSAGGKAVTVIVLGPVLGSMDSREIKTDLACTANGFVLTATITRSADYHGAVNKNVLWRPRIEMIVFLRHPEVMFEAIWKMRLTTGIGVDNAQTPGYPEQQYPITVTATVR